MPGGDYNASRGKSLIEQMWEALDELVDKLRDGSVEPQSEFEAGALRGEAHGIAKCIWLMSQPHFHELKDISRHSHLRWKIRRGEADWVPTPGCEGYNPMPTPVAPMRARPNGVSNSRRKQLDDRQRVQIKAGLAGGIDAPALAQVYGVTLQQVEECR